MATKELKRLNQFKKASKAWVVAQVLADKTSDGAGIPRMTQLCEDVLKANFTAEERKGVKFEYHDVYSLSKRLSAKADVKERKTNKTAPNKTAPKKKVMAEPSKNGHVEKIIEVDHQSLRAAKYVLTECGGDVKAALQLIELVAEIRS